MSDAELLQLAADGVAAAREGLVVRVRPPTPFERTTWQSIPADGLRISVDEDGTAAQNYELSGSLPRAIWVSRKDWHKAVRFALMRKPKPGKVANA